MVVSLVGCLEVFCATLYVCHDSSKRHLSNAFQVTSHQKPGDPQPNNSDLAQELISRDINLVAEKESNFSQSCFGAYSSFDKSQGFSALRQ